MSGKLWKAKAKAQKRKLEGLGLILLKQHEVIQKAAWLAKILRLSRQQQDSNFAGDLSPLSMSAEEEKSLHEFEVYYQSLVNPGAWFPLDAGLF